MLDAEEVVELRGLQERAYGRTGGLGAEDAARLAELTSKRDTGEHPTADIVPAIRDVEAASPVEVHANAAVMSSRRGAAVEPGPAATRPLVTRVAVIALALIVVFGLGVIAGWVLTRPSDRVIEISATQNEWQRALVDGAEYDADSIRVMAIEEGVVIWAATKTQGYTTCLVFGDAEGFTPTCSDTEHVRSSGMDAVVTVDVDDGLKRQVSAELFLTPDDRPAVIAGSFLYGPVDEYGTTYGDEAEAAIAESLVALGFERTSLWVVGYDRQTPIWTAIRAATGETCLIYDGTDEDPLFICDQRGVNPPGEGGLGFERPDEETGGTTSIMYIFGGGPSYLEITREPAPGGAE